MIVILIVLVGVTRMIASLVFLRKKLDKFGMVQTSFYVETIPIGIVGYKTQSWKGSCYACTCVHMYIYTKYTKYTKYNDWQKCHTVTRWFY